MIALKSFVVDQIQMLKKKSDKKQILSNNENKVLINNITEQIEFLKNELCSKDTIIQLFIENSKYSNVYFQNKKNNNSNQTEKFVTPKKTAKLKTSDNKDLNNPASLNRFKILEDKKIDDKENQHNEHEDSISHSTGQPQDTDRVQSQVIVKKSTSSKPKSPTTAILVDSIVKDEYGNIITKSVKRQKHIVVKHFSMEKMQM